MSQCLKGLRVLDLTRVLAGPYCTQMLGDLGADILKIERPFAGDDTRHWGPPFEGNADEGMSAYYLSINRNKKSVAVDIKTPEGQNIIRILIAKSDIVIENFKVGGLEKYGLGYKSLREDFPALIYCAISGYGQDGPLAQEPGYDFVAQGMSGLMAATGGMDQPPMKAGVALSDIMTGMNAAIGILAALNHHHQTGRGQLVDVALTDTTLAAMTNVAQYYLTSGENAPRVGNAHSTIVPYQAFEAADGFVIIAIGNDGQFARFCTFIGHADWATDERFAHNDTRVMHRDILVPMIIDLIKTKTVAEWIEGLRSIDVPCGPVNAMDQVFDEPQIQARGMQIDIDGTALVGSPLKLSETPVSYSSAPPRRGEHTAAVLKNLLDMSGADIAQLQEKKVIEV